MKYLEFLKRKMDIAPETGFYIDISEVNSKLKPHQKVAVQWAIKGGRRAVFKAFGLGKTIVNLEICRLIIKHKGGKALIVLPLGVKQEFVRDAVQILGIESPQYVRNMEEIYATTTDILLTNYERVRDGDIDPNYFTACTLDEAAVLRSYGSDTYQTFMVKFKSVKYKFVFTATPSPNRYKELIHYAAFLEIMDSGQALTRFFQRDSTKANNLTLYPHREDEFWLWCSSWGLWITQPSDLGLEYSDEGYKLPPMEVRYHEMPVERELFVIDRDGQMKIQDDEVVSLLDAMKEKRRSIDERVAKMVEVLRDDRRRALEKKRIRKEVLPGAQRRTTRKAEDSREKELSAEQREIQGEISEMERIQSRAYKRTSEETYRKESGIEETKVKGMVFEQQRESIGTVSQAEIKEIWINRRRIQHTSFKSKWSLCNLSVRTGISKQTFKVICRPRPCHRGGKGASLPEMQCSHWYVQGQSSSTHESSGLPDQYVIWCDLNEEQRAIEKALKNENIRFSSLYGHQDIYTREQLVAKWKNKETTVFLSKTEMYGAGVNLQQCHTMIYVGIDYNFEEFIQGIHRVFRFLQKSPVTIHVIYTSREKRILQILLKKWEQHKYLTKRMTNIIKKYGLSGTSMMEKMTRTMGVKRVEVKGKNFTAVNNDCILEFQNLPDNYFDLLHTSIPFGNHYEYSASYNDLGFNPDTEAFMEQMDFLSPHLLRTLKPGRVFACHVKDRVLFGNTTGDGFPTMEPFHSDCINHYRKHGFRYFGMITVLTDVVRENNQTYRLGWTEQCKDGTKMGVGCPEYILLFRKLPTDTSNAYADVPVSKSKEEYTRAQWQIDAHGFWRTSGDRLLAKAELENIPVSKLQAAYLKYSRNTIYNYQEHVELAKKLDENGKLPASFMVVAPGSWTDQVWDDILRFKTLNAKQTQKRLQNHVCPLQLDIVERIINRYSNPGDLVGDPFGGLGTVGYQALKMGRKGWTCELNSDYFRDSLGYLKAADEDIKVPSLFDFFGEDEIS